MLNSQRQSQGVYIFQNSTYHYFRQVVPIDLRPAIKRTEFRVSLRTADKITARRKAGCLSARIWDIFTALRKGDKRMTQLTAEQIQDLVKAWVEQELANDEAERVLQAKTVQSERVNLEKQAEREEQNKWLESEAREALATGHYSFVKAGAEDILEANNLTVSPDSQDFKALCRELLRGQIELCKVLDMRNRGVYPTAYTPNEVNPYLYTSNVPDSNANKKQKVLISTAFKAYVEDKTLHGNWTPKTVLDVSDKVRAFIELLGDIKVCDISQERLRKTERLLLQYPKSRTKLKKYRELTIEQIKSMDIPESYRLSPKSIVNYLIQINGFLNWLKTMYELPDWISTIMTPPKLNKTVDTRNARDVFDTSDLVKIFNDPWYVKGSGKSFISGRRIAPINGAKFWLPLMALFSGARIEELCQLYLADFKIIDGTKCYELSTDIEDEEGAVKKVKQLKNRASKRIIPIHDELLELGLWEYVQELREKGQNRVFEELSSSGAGGKYSTAFSKWFNRHLKKDLEIKGSKKTGAKVFYSFRHTFINYCVQHGIEDRYFERVVGHKVGGNEITYAHYAKAMSPKTLKAEVLDRIDYEIDLSCLKDNPFARVK